MLGIRALGIAAGLGSRGRGSDSAFARTRVSGQHPSPRSRAGAPGGGRRVAASGRRGSEVTPVSSAGVVPGAPGCPQPGLTWAAECPGGREAAEAANCPGGHHLDHNRTNVQSASGAGGPPEDFSSRGLAPDRSPTHCLTKTPDVERLPAPEPRPSLPASGAERTPSAREGRRGGPSGWGPQPGFPVRRPVGSRRARAARVSLERRGGRSPGRTRPLVRSRLAWRWSLNLCEQPERSGRGRR